MLWRDWSPAGEGTGWSLLRLRVMITAGSQRKAGTSHGITQERDLVYLERETVRKVLQSSLRAFCSATLPESL